MARGMVKRVTTEVERKEEDPTQAALRLAIPNVVTLKIEGYITGLISAGVPDLVIDVFKKKRSLSGLSKVGEIALGEIEANGVEPWIMQSWGPGSYQLRPSLNGRYYSPASMLFKVGEDAPEDRLPPSGAATPDDVDSIIAENVKRIGHVNVMSRLATIAKEFDPKKSEGDEGEGGMKTAELLAMVQAMNAPLIAMLNASEQRTARAEERADKLMERLTTSNGVMSAVKEPLFAEILKKAVDKPEALALLMGGSSSAEPAEEGGWSGLIKAALEQFAPMVQAYMAMQLQKAGMPSLPPAAVAAPGGEGAPLAPPDAPTPPAQGDRRMPMELNEEQQMAKEYLLDFIKSGDLDNAFSTLEAFPGFIPTAQGPMPLGEAILSSIDPDANPRVYLPKLAMLLPEIIKEKMGPLMVKFISHVQDRLRKMQQEAAQPAPEMRPTSREGAQ